MTTISLRSSATLTAYVQTATKLATLATKIASLQKLEKQQRAAVLLELGGIVRQVQVRERVYTLTPAKTESIGQIDSEETVIWLKSNGLEKHVSIRSSEICQPSTFKKLVVDGILNDGTLIKRETTEVVIVT